MAGVDWCTLWPDLNYCEACCKPHDAAYDAGGSIFDFLAANVDLGACMAAFHHPVFGTLALIGTTLAGWIWWLLAQRRRRPMAGSATLERHGVERLPSEKVAHASRLEAAAEPHPPPPRSDKPANYPPASSGLFLARRSMMFTNDERRAIGEAARAFGLPEAHVLAVTEVESGGVSYAKVGGRDEPLIRFEGHIFDRKLAGEKREAARAKGLSHPNAGKVRNPADQSGRWMLLGRAMQIDAAAALESTSWGVGQVMAMHWKRLGFADVHAFVDMARSGLRGQVEIMLRFVRDAGLVSDLAAGRFTSFARAYNGPNFRANRYDEKMAAAAAKFGGVEDPPNGMLRMGSKGQRVRELQDLLVRSGAAVKVDGDFGPTTKAALTAFQQQRGLSADGIYGPATEGALAELRQSADDKAGKQKLLDVGAVKRGFGTVVAAGVSASQIQDAKSALEGAAGQIVGTGIQSAILDHLASGLTVVAAILGAAGAAYAIVGWMRSKQTVEA